MKQLPSKSVEEERLKSRRVPGLQSCTQAIRPCVCVQGWEENAYFGGLLG